MKLAKLDFDLPRADNQTGIAIEDGWHNRIEGNVIGLDRAGLEALPNDTGVQITGNSSFNVIGGLMAALT